MFVKKRFYFIFTFSLIIYLSPYLVIGNNAFYVGFILNQPLSTIVYNKEWLTTVNPYVVLVIMSIINCLILSIVITFLWGWIKRRVNKNADMIHNGREE